MVTTIITKAGEYRFKGVSTDTKPTEITRYDAVNSILNSSAVTETIPVPVNSLFLELDTGKSFYFDGEIWKSAGGISTSNPDISALASLVSEINNSIGELNSGLEESLNGGE